MMKKSLWGILLLLTALTAAADEQDPMAVCDDRYAKCMDKCDGMENSPPECYDTCDSAYRNCLDIANGYTPDQPAVSPKHDVNATAKAPQK